jgi:transposase-like protein
MKAAAFKKWSAQLLQLSKQQRDQLLALLRPSVELDRVCAVINSSQPASCECVHCRTPQCYRHGFHRGLQRYRCRSCGKTFTALTGTPLARLRHRAKWLDYLGAMLDSKSVRASARAVGVHRNTGFRWRHRFLHLSKHDRPEGLRGIAEADELFMLESQKGARQLTRPARKRGGVASRRGISREHDCVLVARDREGRTFDFVPGRGAVTAAQLHQHLLPVLDASVLLVTDSHGAYRVFAREAGITHEAVNLRQGERVRGAVHVQNVNGYHRRFRQWLARFNGVASRYLPNYLGWRWALDGERLTSADDLLRAAIGVFNAKR